MPHLFVQTSIPDNQISDEFIKELSAKSAQLLEKPTKFMAVQVTGGQRLIFGGTNEPTAIIELTAMDLNKNQTALFSKEIMSFLEEKLGIQPERMLIKFHSLPGYMIGWNKGTL